LAARSPGRPITLDFPIWAKSGTWCDTETTVTSLVHDPDIRGLVLNTRDISERRRLEEQLTLQAYSDGLTGLANRSLFRSKVETALKVALDRAEVGVLFLDLDGFKAVNDEEGHQAGDRVLCEVAATLKAEARGSDVVVRYGGDEFLVILPGGTPSAARSLAERVRTRLAGRVGVSAGVAVYRPELHSPDELIREADRALYASKPRFASRGELN